MCKIILIYVNSIFNFAIEEAFSTAEQLLLDCYSKTSASSSLDEFGATMAASAFKQNRSKFIAPIFPPTTNAFYRHGQRVACPVNI